MRVLPVALTSTTRWSKTREASPASRSPTISWLRPAGASPKALSAFSNSAWQARAVSGVFSDGFHTTALPQTSARVAFHAHTATGKLKALITPTTPSGCQDSRMWWPGRSEAMVRPYSWRDRPTAKSQMSIISCTSPRPSWVILPASQDTSSASSALWARSTSPNRRTSSPRRGAGTLRQASKAACAAAILAGTLLAGSSATAPMRLPSMGLWMTWAPWLAAWALTPRRLRRLSTMDSSCRRFD
ncbi:hypothetical protein D3C85_554440 [compost metagenome]